MKAQEEEKKEGAPIKPKKERKGKSKKEEMQLAKEEDLRNIYYFSDPVKVTDLWNEEDPA